LSDPAPTALAARVAEIAPWDEEDQVGRLIREYDRLVDEVNRMVQEGNQVRASGLMALRQEVEDTRSRCRTEAARSALSSLAAAIEGGLRQLTLIREAAEFQRLVVRYEEWHTPFRQGGIE